MFLLIAFLIFTGALFAAAYYVFIIPQRQTAELVTTRLREIRARTGARSKKGSTDLVHSEQRGSRAFLSDFMSWLGILRRLQQYIEQANLKYRAADVFILCIIIAVTFFVVFTFLDVVVTIRILLALLLGSLPVLYIRRVRNRRMNKFEESLPDAIDLFNRSMKAGHNIHSGLEAIASETFDPIRMEFKKLIEELALGSQLEDALRNLGKRVPLIDLKFFITGLVLQRQTGANMVQVLENLSLLIRERLTLAAKMKAATAQQRFSAGLLCIMPLVVGLGFWFLKPEYIKLLYTDETGSKFLTYAVISEIVGILVIRRIARPRF